MSRSQTLRFREQREGAEAQLAALQAQEASVSQQAATAQAASAARIAELAGVRASCIACGKSTEIQTMYSVHSFRAPPVGLDSFIFVSGLERVWCSPLCQVS